MAPKDLAIRNAKPGPKPIKLADGGGMFLLVNWNEERKAQLAAWHANGFPYLQPVTFRFRQSASL